MMNKFRDWNYRTSVKAYESLFGRASEQDKKAFTYAPYAWLYLLIPIAGIAGFYGIVWEYDIYIRQKRLEERRKK